MNADDVLEMKEVCEEQGILFMEALMYMYHFHPQYARVNQIIDSDEIGDVQFVRAGFLF